jgi:hypothetical protein
MTLHPVPSKCQIYEEIFPIFLLSNMLKVRLARLDLHDSGIIG